MSANDSRKHAPLGQTTFYSTGVNPGFAFDAFPIALTSVARRIDRLHVLELVDMSDYTSESIVSELIGMGMSPDTLAPMEYLTDLRWSPYFPCVQLLTDALGVTYDEFVISHTKAVTDVPIDLPWGRIDAGTVAVRRIVIEAVTAGSTAVGIRVDLASIQRCCAPMALRQSALRGDHHRRPDSDVPAGHRK